jgi:hypothetical protein
MRTMTSWNGLSVLGAVLTKEIHEALDDVVGQVVGTDVATGGDGRSDLGQVRLTGVARREVLLETTSIAPREGAVEVVAHEFNGVATDQRRW